MKVKNESEVAQSCPTPSDSADCSLPGSSVHGIFQARVLESGAIAFSKAYLVTFIYPQSYLAGVRIATTGYDQQRAGICEPGGFPGGSDGKESACNAGDPGSVAGSGRSPGEEIGNPLKHSCLENPVDRGAWRATVPGVAKSQTGLSCWRFHFSISPSADLKDKQNHKISELEGTWKKKKSAKILFHEW